MTTRIIKLGSIAGSVSLLMLLVLGCAQVPQAEIDAAKASLAEAEDEGASTYASDELSSAQEAMQAVERELDEQQAKFAMLRSYEEAKGLIAEANQKAASAKEAAITTRERYRSESVATLASVRSSLETVGTSLSELAGCRPQPKGFSTDLAMLGGQRDSLDNEIESVEVALEEEDLMGAKTMASSLEQRVQALVTDIESAKSKLRCRSVA